jgi:hypothetical protein
MAKGKKLFVAGLMGALAVSAGGVALGGFHFPEDDTGVVVDDTDPNYRLAYGDLGYTHNTYDPDEYIGCSTITQLQGPVVAGLEYVYTYVYCFARDAWGRYNYCYFHQNNGQSEDGGHIKMDWTVQSLNGDSHLYFSKGTNDVCREITVSHSSMYAAKTAP